MKNEAKIFLRGIRSEAREVRRLKELIRAKEDQLFPGAIKYDALKIQTSPKDAMSETIAAIADQIATLEKIVATMESKKATAYRMVAALEEENPRYASVIRLYYLEPYDTQSLTERQRTWERTAEILNFDLTYVMRDLHGGALKRLNELFF